jgi:2-polyprenyl-3-methyl-5-hydroxy-6-metoxy-1,4-benzoquinol methylase
MDREEHWQSVYGGKKATQVGWYAPHLERSITMIQATAAVLAEIIDVGGGASTLVDDLLARGYANVTVLDVSSTALAVAQERLGDQMGMVRWLAADVTKASLPSAAYDTWHDRAVFHFLTDQESRRAYVDLATRSLRVGGHAILSTFDLDGPRRCSGLEVVRYSADELSREFGPAFALRQEVHESHHTPSGVVQRFMYCLFERIAGAG